METTQLKILISLLAAHFLVDFILQSDKDVKQKSKTITFIKHISLVTIFSYFFLGIFDNYIIPLVILITHTVIDLVKVKIKKDNLMVFLLDQFFHLITIFVLALNAEYFISEQNRFIWNSLLGNEFYFFLIILSSLVIVTKISGILISYLIKPLQVKINKTVSVGNDNLPQTGKIIGYLERFIILLSILMNVPALIGFLITAKSILRYSEIKNENDKIYIEYVLIGTLYSFALGISFSYLTTEFLKRINF